MCEYSIRDHNAISGEIEFPYGPYEVVSNMVLATIDPNRPYISVRRSNDWSGVSASMSAKFPTIGSPGGPGIASVVMMKLRKI
jgi:hypothetical protein